MSKTQWQEDYRTSRSGGYGSHAAHLVMRDSRGYGPAGALSVGGYSRRQDWDGEFPILGPWRRNRPSHTVGYLPEAQADPDRLP